MKGKNQKKTQKTQTPHYKSHKLNSLTKDLKMKELRPT